MSEKVYGFEPYFDTESKVLILGSFPSVKSRHIHFYYGNKQNRFWKMLYGYFGEQEQEDVSQKKEFLSRNNIALWDIVTACEIKGSSDASIRDYELADVPALLKRCKISMILLNGTTAYKLFCKAYHNCGVPYFLLPSTSPANVRYDVSVWYAALDKVFKNNLSL